MGLDKKPTPPQKRVKEELPTSKSSNAKEATDVDEDIEIHSNAEPDTPQEMETEAEETIRQKTTKDGTNSMSLLISKTQSLIDASAGLLYYAG